MTKSNTVIIWFFHFNHHLFSHQEQEFVKSQDFSNIPDDQDEILVKALLKISILGV